MMFTSGARGRAESVAPENEILSTSRIDDWDDSWGTGLSWLGAICDILTLTGEDVPPKWNYRPSPYMGWDSLEDYPASYILEILGIENHVALTGAQYEQLLFAGEVFHRILQLVPEEDRY